MITKSELKSLIYTKYRTISQCAKDLGIDESTLSRNLNKPTIALLQRLRSLYIDIPIQPEEKRQTEVPDNNNEITHLKELLKTNKEQIELLKDSIEEKKEMIDYFRAELKRKEQKIIAMNNIIENYVKEKNDG